MACFVEPKTKNSQGQGVERFDMGLVHKTSVACRRVCSYEDAQASEQQTLNLHNVTLAQLELIWPHWTVVGHCYTGTCD